MVKWQAKHNICILLSSSLYFSQRLFGIIWSKLCGFGSDSTYQHLSHIWGLSLQIFLNRSTSLPCSLIRFFFFSDILAIGFFGLGVLSGFLASLWGFNSFGGIFTVEVGENARLDFQLPFGIAGVTFGNILWVESIYAYVVIPLVFLNTYPFSIGILCCDCCCEWASCKIKDCLSFVCVGLDEVFYESYWFLGGVEWFCPIYTVNFLNWFWIFYAVIFIWVLFE